MERFLKYLKLIRSSSWALRFIVKMRKDLKNTVKEIVKLIKNRFGIYKRKSLKKSRNYDKKKY